MANMKNFPYFMVKKNILLQISLGGEGLSYTGLGLDYAGVVLDCFGIGLQYLACWY